MSREPRGLCVRHEVGIAPQGVCEQPIALPASSDSRSNQRAALHGSGQWAGQSDGVEAPAQADIDVAKGLGRRRGRMPDRHRVTGRTQAQGVRSLEKGCVKRKSSAASRPLPLSIFAWDRAAFAFAVRNRLCVVLGNGANRGQI